MTPSDLEVTIQNKICSQLCSCPCFLFSRIFGCVAISSLQFSSPTAVSYTQFAALHNADLILFCTSRSPSNDLCRSPMLLLVSPRTYSWFVSTSSPKQENYQSMSGFVLFSPKLNLLTGCSSPDPKCVFGSASSRAVVRQSAGLCIITGSKYCLILAVIIPIHPRSWTKCPSLICDWCVCVCLCMFIYIYVMCHVVQLPHPLHWLPAWAS